jgi:hypothetical protein
VPIIKSAGVLHFGSELRVSAVPLDRPSKPTTDLMASASDDAAANKYDMNGAGGR